MSWSWYACINLKVESRQFDLATYNNVKYYSFESEDGTKVQESGAQKQITAEDAGTVSKGTYSYVHEGATITVSWTADENGFVAKGAHLPVAPPMPEHVVKLLADLKAAGQL